MAELTGVLIIETKQAANGNDYYILKVDGKSAGSTFKAQTIKGFQNGDVVTVTYTQKGQYKNVDKVVFPPAGTRPQTSPVPATTTPPPQKAYNSGVVNESILRQTALKCAVEVVNATVPTPEKNSKASVRTKQAAILNMAVGFMPFLLTGKVEAVEAEIEKATAAAASAGEEAVPGDD